MNKVAIRGLGTSTVLAEVSDPIDLRIYINDQWIAAAQSIAMHEHRDISYDHFSVSNTKRSGELLIIGLPGELIDGSLLECGSEFKLKVEAKSEYGKALCTFEHQVVVCSIEYQVSIDDIVTETKIGFVGID